MLMLVEMDEFIYSLNIIFLQLYVIEKNGTCYRIRFRLGYSVESLLVLESQNCQLVKSYSADYQKNLMTDLKFLLVCAADCTFMWDIEFRFRQVFFSQMSLE